MKWYRVMVIVLMVSISFNLSMAQTANPFPKAAFIEPYQLEVTYSKTTHLVFPSAITTIDRGSAAILVQKASGVENILQVKAEKKDFEQTNLTVITSDGKLYSFLVNYADTPPYLNINVSNSAELPPVMYSQSVTDENSVALYAAKAAHAKNNIHTLSDESSRVTLDINGFYIKDNTLFCKLHFENNSQINYDIEQFRFYIRDKKLSKRTAAQEIEIHPLYSYGETNCIKGKSAQLLVAAFPKFTIPDGKYLAVQVLEKNGGRQLLIKAKNRHIMKARII